MILRIKQFFESRLLIQEVEPQNEIDHKLKMSCAVLMLEMVHVDGELHENEAQKIRHLLQRQFDINETETEEILAIAHEEKTSATDYYQFTKLINQHYSQQQKITLVEHLWHIAYADDSIDKFEEHLVRRLADLLHVPHRHFIQSKHRAVDS
ncbi:MAG: TerB family tellurite resistance protein [Gammaproteobacteria bacterium]|nr:TerB family tellurite resistance protein [Gammaproteobacteria bacterium]MCW8924442.1 TerB family tellurite resistance protein [Gammaproteobacteria bacterium]